MDVHPTKNVSIGIDPYPYNVYSDAYSDDIENLWLITCIQFNDG
jgi:hypothetical protein